MIDDSKHKNINTLQILLNKKLYCILYIFAWLFGTCSHPFKFVTFPIHKKLKILFSIMFIF